MAKLTIAAATVGRIPGKPGRKALVINLETGDGKWGFEPTTTASGATQGLPMTVGQPLAFTGDGPDTFAGPIHIATTAGCDVTYTERL